MKLKQFVLSKLNTTLKRRGIKKEDFGKAIGVSKSSIYTYLDGTTDFSFDVFEKMLENLGFTLDVFFEFSPKPATNVASEQEVKYKVLKKVDDSDIRILRTHVEGLIREIETKDKIITLLEQIARTNIPEIKEY